MTYTPTYPDRTVYEFVRPDGTNRTFQQIIKNENLCPSCIPVRIEVDPLKPNRVLDVVQHAADCPIGQELANGV